MLRRCVVNEELVRLGLATAAHIECPDDDATKLVMRLITAELKAEKRGIGIGERPSFRERVRRYPRELVKTVLASLKSFIWRSKKNGS